MEYLGLDDVITGKGLRLVLVQGRPSPWGQAAKTFFDMKGVPYVVAPQIPGGLNQDLIDWSGQGSGPVAVWDNETPKNHWLDLMFMAERIAPEPSIIPKDAGLRAQMIGLSHEICGEGGIGWSRRAMLFKPAIESGNPPENIRLMAERYRYDDAEANAAPERVAGILRALSAQLADQKSNGSDYLIGNSVSALDIYWTAFANLLRPLPDDIMPAPPELRQAFGAVGPVIEAALDDSLIRHRDYIFGKYFRSPMEY